MTGIDIKELPRAEYAGHRFTVEYISDRYYDVELLDEGFRLRLTECESVKKGFSDTLFSDWLEAPVAYGAFRGYKLLGFVEGSRESWHNVFRISNVFIEAEERGKGLGTQLLQHVIDTVSAADYRAIVLETQTCNYPAICLYKKLGFRLCRIDVGEYTNSDVENHEVRIDLILKLNK